MARTDPAHLVASQRFPRASKYNPEWVLAGVSGGANSLWLCLHSAPWWRQHWERTGIVEVAVADTLADGWRFWLDWIKTIAPGNVTEIRALEADTSKCLGYVRVVGHRRAEAKLVEPLLSMPAEYIKRPLLRG